MGNAWVIYDGRAEYMDEDDCSVVEMADSWRGLRDMLYYNREQDGVLFEYETKGRALLVNGRKIGHIREGKSALLAKCSAPQHTEPRNAD